jgi:hypothetical protein
MRPARLTQIRHRGGCALSVPEAPVRHCLPRPPTLGRAATLEVPAHRVIAAVLPGRIIHRENNELRPVIAVQIGDRDSGPLVFPEIPIRHGDPGPPRCHRPISIQRPTAVIALVAPGRRIHHQDD